MDDADFRMAAFASDTGHARVRMDGSSFHVLVVTQG